MSATIIKLYASPTRAQIRRLREFALAEMATPVRDDDRHLANDLARLTFKIAWAMFLIIGRGIPLEEADIQAIADHGEFPGNLFAQLYLDANRSWERRSITTRCPRGRADGSNDN